MQLAAALTSAGDRDAANKIRYLGREREREAAWNQHNWGPWLCWSVLSYGFGYGIGLRPLLVIFWVLVFSAIGAAILWHTVPTTRSPDRGKLWCFGASLARLLPVIEISKELRISSIIPSAWVSRGCNGAYSLALPLALPSWAGYWALSWLPLWPA